MKRLALCILTLALCGCETAPATVDPETGEPIANPAPSFNFNGAWKYDASGALPAACITITNLRITEFDKGCAGNLLLLGNNSQAYALGSLVRISAIYSDVAGDDTRGGIYTYSLVSQPDGTLVGTGTLRIEPGGSGPVVTENVVWRRP
jgi:hypothetical protein